MRSGDVDTGKFASWPLLRPDELAALPSEVLKASLAALDLLCGQTSDEDAIADYGRRQRERTASILSERAAQVRVRALLTAGTLASLSMAPSHDVQPSDELSRRDRDRCSSLDVDIVPEATTGLRHANGERKISSVQSPPRVRDHHQHQAGPVAGTPVAATPEAFDTAQRRESGDNKAGVAASSHRCDDRNRDPDESSLQGFTPESSSYRVSKPDWSGGGKYSDANTSVGETCMSCQDTCTSQQDRGQPPVKSVLHEKWGSVFVVGGGQRRRRTLVRRKSLEAEDTPATRRANVDKERQERRKASLCRLLARKEQRALQQETRRKRRAAAARVTAAAAAAATTAAAAAEAAAVASAATTAEAETAAAAGVTSVTTNTSATPSETSNLVAGPTQPPSSYQPRSPTSPVKPFESNTITNGPATTPAPVPASPPSRSCLSNGNTPESVLGASREDTTECLGSNEAAVHENIDNFAQGGVAQPCESVSPEGVAQPCGSVSPEGVAQAVLAISEMSVYASGGNVKADEMAIRDLSSSESESVSGGDSSDDDVSADEGGEQKGSSVAQIGPTEGIERAVEDGEVHVAVIGGDDDADGIAENQRAVLLEGVGDLSRLDQTEQANFEAVTGINPPSQTRRKRDELTPVTPLGATQNCQVDDIADSSDNATIAIEVGHRSVERKSCDNADDNDDAHQRMTTATPATSAVLPCVDVASTDADDSKEGSGTSTQSDIEWEFDSGAVAHRSIDGAIDLPGPLDARSLRAAPRNSGSPTNVYSQELTASNEAPAASFKPSLDERLSRRTSDALKDQQPGAGKPSTETDRILAPRPKEVPTGGRRGRLEGAIVNHSSGPAVVRGRHRTKSLSSMPTTSGDGDTRRDNGGNSPPCRLFGVGYTECFPKIGAILSAYHNGRALTREGDCRSLPLTSSIMARGRGGRATATGLTVTEEEACLQLQLKLYAIYVRVIKDYAAVFSFGDEWPTSGAEGPSSLVYSGDPSALHYRVNSKARPEVYNIVTDVLNNRCDKWEELPTGLGLKTTWNLLWTWSKPHIQYSSLLVWQKVNHFPNSRELTRKDLLNKHISRFMAPGGRLAREFHIMPQTFVLPHEFTTFVAAFTSSGQCSQARGKSRGATPTCEGVESSDESRGGDWGGGEAGAMGGVARRENVWIMKPVGMSRGRGIRLIDDIKNISYADKVVLQRYIGNPLLLDGYKFDLRLYVLVTSFNPLEAFIYKEGFARVSTHLYEKGDIGNPFIHLTNSSVQRLNESGATRDNPLHHANVSEAGGTKTTLCYLWRRLKAKGVDVAALWAGICSVVVKSLICVEAAIPNQPNSFEVFGYDVLIDDKLRPWLIEVNASPSMARDSHIDRQVKEGLIIDTIHLVDPLPFDRQKLADVLEKRLKTFNNSKAWSFKERRASESSDLNHSSAPPFEGENGAKASAHGARPRRTKDEVELDRDLNAVLRGRRPRQVGELPAKMGNFVRLCPATAAHRHAKRLKRRVVRPNPGDDSLDTNQ